MKLREIEKGKRAVHDVELPLVNVGCRLITPPHPALTEAREREGATKPPPDSVRVGVRCILGSELADVLENARAFAAARGIQDPKDNDPIYDLGLQVNTLLVACVDPDNHDEPFFDSVEQILTSEHLGRDGIQFLYEAWNTWQGITSPQVAGLEVGQMMVIIDQLAKAGDDLPKFLATCQQFAPGLLVILLRILVNQFSNSLTGKSLSGSDTETPGQTSRSEASDNGEPE